jgi:hypothetical protein
MTLPTASPPFSEDFDYKRLNYYILRGMSILFPYILAVSCEVARCPQIKTKVESKERM